MAKQVHQLLRVSIAMALSYQKDKRIDHMFRHVVLDKKLTIRYITGAKYIQNALETKTVNSSLVRALSEPVQFGG